jgi:anti-sigma B factor antagonist
MEQLERQEPRLAIERATDAGGVPLIKLSGELDMASAETLRETVDGILGEHPQRIVFELSQLTFMDSSGIAILILASNNVEKVELRNPQTIVRRVVEVAGLTGILGLEQS